MLAHLHNITPENLIGRREYLLKDGAGQLADIVQAEFGEQACKVQVYVAECVGVGEAEGEVVEGGRRRSSTGTVLYMPIIIIVHI